MVELDSISRRSPWISRLKDLVSIHLSPLCPAYSSTEHWKDVALAIFKYISLLRSQPPSSTIFNEIKAIAEISFRFAERTKIHRYVTSLSNAMQHPVPRDKIVSAGSLLEEFRADELSAALQLLDPKRASIGVSSRELPPGVEGSFDRTEPIYGTEYMQMPIGEQFFASGERKSIFQDCIDRSAGNVRVTDSRSAFAGVEPIHPGEI